MKPEELIRVDDLMAKIKGKDAYFVLVPLLIGLPRIDITAVTTELKKARETISLLQEDNACLR